MIVPICITTGTTEGALTRNLNRKHRRASEKNGFPGGKQVGDSQSRPGVALIHRTPLTRVATNVGSAMRSQVQGAVYPRVVSIPPEQSSACWRRRMAESASFFFQAEDGIRDLTVTGVQTCALPI